MLLMRRRSDQLLFSDTEIARFYEYAYLFYLFTAIHYVLPTTGVTDVKPVTVVSSLNLLHRCSSRTDDTLIPIYKRCRKLATKI